jgi:hypothetical protein
LEFRAIRRKEADSNESEEKKEKSHKIRFKFLAILIGGIGRISEERGDCGGKMGGLLL